MIENVVFNINYYLYRCYYSWINDWIPVIKQLHPLTILAIIRYAEWSCGYEYWNKKPSFGLYYFYYDGNHLALHVGKFWVSVYY